jgi:hypothetical protein
VHVACRDNPDQSFLVANGESDVQTPAIVRTAQSVKTRLNLAVPGIVEQQQRLVEKDLLRLRLTDPVLVHTLARVSSIPLKALASRQINHNLYMTYIYVPGQFLNSMVWNRGAVTDMFAR